MKTKFNFEFDAQTLENNRMRLINQIYKLIPMRENEEDWEKQLYTVIIEITGLNEIFKSNNDKFLILLSKLEGLKNIDIPFSVYRKTVFEIITLLKEAK